MHRASPDCDAARSLARSERPGDAARSASSIKALQALEALAEAAGVAALGLGQGLEPLGDLGKPSSRAVLAMPGYICVYS